MWSPKRPLRNAGFPAGVVFRLLLCLAVPAISHGQSQGQADIALQGYYLGGNSQPLIDTTGLALHFQTILPGVGFLSGNLEGYGSQNRLRTGEDFVELRGAPWLGQRWDVTGGDFRAPATLFELPMNNLFTPEIAARGVKVQVSHEDRQYTFFAGEETLSAGPRIPYRILAPQTVVGASALRKLGHGLWIGGRFLQFSSSASGVADNPNLFPPGRELGMVRTFSTQSLYSPAKPLKLYAEVSRPASEAQRNLVSSLVGAGLETGPFVLRANYVREGVLYFPLVGYFAGDRQGPFGEIRYRPHKGFELSGSASQYRNNLERNPAAASLNSSSASGGASASLPLAFSASAQYSTIRFSSQEPGADATISLNRQINATLSRTIGRHSLHASWRDIALDQSSGFQRQRSTEAEDVFHIKHMFLGGAVRWQQSSGTDRRNSLFYRASAQGNAGPLTAFVNIEIGNDLANQTIFSTNSYSTTVIGLAVKLFRDWNLQTEVFRNKLNVDLNPESIFVLQGGGVAVGQDLAATSQWSFLFRLVKQLRWGGGLPVAELDRLTARAAPLVGTVDGQVRIKTLGAPEPAAAVPVSLDGQRVVATGADGRYHFSEVPEGIHEVSLALAELPADFDPGEPSQAHLLVQARRIARADLEVFPLLSVEGNVDGPAGSLEGVVIRLAPGSRYTTTGPDGHFGFYNVREGNYDLALDPKSLPENGQLRAEGSVRVVVRLGVPIPPIGFSFVVIAPSKPIRTVLDKK